MNIKNILSSLLAVCLISSCYYDKEELLYGANKCDTSNVKFSVQISGIINSSCISCHGGTAASGGGVKLGTYADVKVYADNGLLLNAVTRFTNTMPKGGPRLSDCRIAEIRTWLRNNAPNN
ncbi:MAG: cytochrome c [Lacibacter sp.]|jgi:hypothetical protein